jgi:hypothetical protein
VQHTFTDLDHINNLNITKTFDGHLTSVVLLPTRCRVEGRLVKNHQVSTVLLFHIVVDCDNFSLEVHLLTMVIVEILCLSQVNRIVQNLLGSLANTLLSCGDFIIKVSRNRLL